MPRDYEGYLYEELKRDVLLVDVSYLVNLLNELSEEKREQIKKFLK